MDVHGAGCFPCHNMIISVSVVDWPVVFKMNVRRECKAGITSQASRHCIYADKELNESMSHGKT